MKNTVKCCVISLDVCLILLFISLVKFDLSVGKSVLFANYDYKNELWKVCFQYAVVLILSNSLTHECNYTLLIKVYCREVHYHKCMVQHDHNTVKANVKSIENTKASSMRSCSKQDAVIRITI